jgi:hypothetical protein
MPVVVLHVGGEERRDALSNQLIELTAPSAQYLIIRNDSDADGDQLHPILVSGPAHGTLALSANGSFSMMSLSLSSGSLLAHQSSGLPTIPSSESTIVSRTHHLFQTVLASGASGVCATGAL